MAAVIVQSVQSLHGKLEPSDAWDEEEFLTPLHSAVHDSRIVLGDFYEDRSDPRRAMLDALDDLESARIAGSLKFHYALDHERYLETTVGVALQDYIWPFIERIRGIASVLMRWDGIGTLPAAPTSDSSLPGDLGAWWDQCFARSLEESRRAFAAGARVPVEAVSDNELRQPEDLHVIREG